MEYIHVLFSVLSIFSMSYFIGWQVLSYKTILPTGFGMIILLLGYGLYPVFFMLGYTDVNKSYGFSIGSGADLVLHLQAAVCIFVFLSFFFLGYILVKTRFRVVANSVMEEKFTIYFTVIFCFSSVCYFSYVYMYGGFAYIADNISQIRSGRDANKNYLAAFLNIFSGYYVFLVYSLCAYVLILRRRSRLTGTRIRGMWVWLWMFVTFFIFVLAKKYLDGGRGGVISVFIGVSLVCSLYFKKIKFGYVVLVVLLSVLVILYGKTLLFQLFSSDGLHGARFEYDLFDVINSVVSEFAHLYLSIVNAMEKGLGAERYFGDFIYWFLKPLKLIGEEGYDSISYYNTYHLLGHWSSDVPPGMVAFMYMEGGMLFVPFGAVCTGMFFSVFDDIVYNSSFSENPFVFAFLVLCIIEFSRLFMGFDFALFIQSTIAYQFLFFCFFAMGYIKLYRFHGCGGGR